MLYGAIFGCVDAALTIAACLSYKSPFVSPFGKKEEANKKKKSFSAGFSDQITTLMAYKVIIKHKIFLFIKVEEESVLIICSSLDCNIYILDVSH